MISNPSLKRKNQKNKNLLQFSKLWIRQNLLLNKFINKLEREENEINSRVSGIKIEISEIEKRLAALRESYSKYLVWLYKSRSSSGLKFVFNSDTLNEAVNRIKYLEIITAENDKVSNDLAGSIKKLEDLKSNLEKEINEKEIISKEKTKEKENLRSKLDRKRNLITELHNDQTAILESITDKRKAEIKIKNLISKLIEDDRNKLTRIKQEQLKDDSFNIIPFNEYDTFEQFSDMKGRLNWPVRSGKINRGFGENKNVKLKTVTLNYGIDIKTESNSSVYAVAEGIVSIIEWVPGYGSVVIITHRGNYRTVYGHLIEIAISEGDKINGGDTIGRVNETLEGNILHFEIWSERNYQNPELWLARK